MLELMRKREWASILFNRFFRWYVSYLNAYSLTLLRSHEFAADLDRLTAHDLSNENVEQLCRELAQDGKVREAYLVRKEVVYRPDNPFYALGVVVKRPWYEQIIEVS